ncbi:AMP-binding protein [Amycolatopsis jejuensis]|uniref:AMP-binding protein n=1 Tax=Amycolatopsis jejuensis TaxID=330084 RepID=UPI000524D6D7|nr:AMP-binding protein [Amycolatopsis jejuensis]
MSNVVSAVWEHEPGKIAVRAGGTALSYRDLTARAGAFGELLTERGIRPGDRVLLVAPTGLEFTVAYLGALAVGATVVTVNPLCAVPEFEYFLTDSGCSLVVTQEDCAERPGKAAEKTGVGVLVIPADLGSARDFRPLPRADTDVAVLLYTSGTTGRPKGAMLTHGNIAAAVTAYHELLTITSAERFGTALPLFHVFGQVAVLMSALRAGASVSLVTKFSGEALLDLAAEHRLTILCGVPTMWIGMLHATSAAELSDLRLAASGGAGLPAEVARTFEDRFGVTVLDGYGLSETASAGSFARPGRPAKEGSAGQPLPGLTIRVLDDDGDPVPVGEVGEVTISGPVVFAGYWGRESNGNVVHTGDLGRMDDDGYLWIVDRKKDLIIRGGYNVYPREIEEQLYAYPGVQEAAVVGVPDARLGEEIAAVVVPAANARIDPAELRGWLAERVAAYKVPRLYQLVEELPRGSTGKLLKREIDRDAVARNAVRAR